MDISRPDDAYWLDKFKGANAFWKHDGHEERPYATTTGGRITNQFFKGSKVAQHPGLLEQATRELVKRANVYLYSCKLHSLHADVVVAPAKGGITLGYEMARRFPLALAWFTEPMGEGKNRHMTLSRFDEPISGKYVLAVEDVTTTGTSVDSAIEAMFRFNPHIIVYDFVLCLANRSGKDTTMAGKKIISLVTITDARTWHRGSNSFIPGGGELVEPVDPDKDWHALIRPYYSRSDN